MRKGQYILGYKSVFYFIVALFLLTFIFLYLHSAFNTYETKKIQCTDIAVEELMIAKLLYSDCFTYEDTELGRTLPGTVDKNKFSQESLETCFTFITKNINISLEGETIGQQIADPVHINKTIWVYENGEKRPATIQFTFEEPVC